jgi:hypothetical protein
MFAHVIRCTDYLHSFGTRYGNRIFPCGLHFVNIFSSMANAGMKSMLAVDELQDFTVKSTVWHIYLLRIQFFVVVYIHP